MSHQLLVLGVISPDKGKDDKGKDEKGEDKEPEEAAAPASPAPVPQGAAATPTGGQVGEPEGQPEDKPKDKDKGLASATGTVLVRAPGAAVAVPMTAATPVVSGTMIDASNGTVELETVVDDSGRTQRARFRGAAFRMTLSPTTGMVDIHLTATPKNCDIRRATLRAAGRASRKPIRLWAKDSNGRYRTHGRNSVATVRGTEWSTTETCAGTRTRVMRGAVSVRDKASGRSVLVRAGHNHLARAGR